MKVEIKRFAELENVSFSTPVEVRGKNKLGKTTILNAISWCIFGKDINGKDMNVAIYKHNETLEDCFATVIIEKDGFRYLRKSEPTFSRTGVLKSRVNTTLEIDRKKVTQREWDEHWKFNTFKGTQSLNIDLLLANPLLFFDIDYKDRRSILNEIAIYDDADLSTFDFNGKKDKIKSIKRQLNENVKEIEISVAKFKSIYDVEREIISQELIDAKEKYEAITKGIDKDLIKSINDENSAKIAERSETILNLNNNIIHLRGDISLLEQNLRDIRQREFKIVEKYEKIDTTSAEKDVEVAKNALNGVKFYESVIDFFNDNQKRLEEDIFVIEKVQELESLKMQEFDNSSDDSLCPIDNSECEIASSNARKSFETKKEAKIKEIHRELTQYYKNLMNNANSFYQNYKNNYENAKKIFSDLLEKNETLNQKNLQIEEANVAQREKFEKTKKESEDFTLKEIEVKKTRLEKFEHELEHIKNTEIEIKEIPVAVEIDEDLENLYNIYKENVEKNIKADAINENNARQRILIEKDINTLKGINVSLEREILALNIEIKQYIEKIKTKLKNIFVGNYKLEFEFFSENLDGELNDNVCNIYADGELFMNEAKQVNVSLQIAKGLQDFYNKKYTILLDRTESVNELQYYNMDIIYTKVTEDNQLIINKL